MEMFLMALCLSLLGVAVSTALFAAATVDERRAQAAPLEPRLAPETPQRFFTTVAPPVLHVQSGIPIDVLLLRLEQHVRLEQAAAESFHQLPTRESLHIRTVSPLVH